MPKFNKNNWNLNITSVYGLFKNKDEPNGMPSTSKSENEEIEDTTFSGMSWGLTSFFLVAQMAGAGFLALPRSLADSGWIGLFMLILFAFSVAFSGTRLGHSWVILEERWPEYKKPARQPYMEIAKRSLGPKWRSFTMAVVLITLIGSSIVYIILIAQFMSSLIHQVSMCTIVLIVGICLIPLTWLGTPKDFWQASVLAVVATLIACAVIFIQLLVDSHRGILITSPNYQNPTFSSFSLGFGTILFSYGGASVFPTIQNDMDDRSQFWKCVTVGFLALLAMYLPVAVTGYYLLGFDVPSNILLFQGSGLSIYVKIAIVFEVINLIGTYLIAFNPVCQSFEEIFNFPRSFGWKRVLLRTSIVVVELLVALIFPDFGLILNLVGGSTVTACTFLLPPIMYMRLVNDHSNENWPRRTLPKWEKIFLYEIMFVGVIGGISATASAVIGIIDTPMSASCFAQFFA